MGWVSGLGSSFEDFAVSVSGKPEVPKPLKNS